VVVAIVDASSRRRIAGSTPPARSSLTSCAVSTAAVAVHASIVPSRFGERTAAALAAT